MHVSMAVDMFFVLIAGFIHEHTIPDDNETHCNDYEIVLSLTTQCQHQLNADHFPNSKCVLRSLFSLKPGRD